MEVSAGCLCTLKMHFFIFCIEKVSKKILGNTAQFQLAYHAAYSQQRFKFFKKNYLGHYEVMQLNHCLAHFEKGINLCPTTKTVKVDAETFQGT